MKTFCSHFFRDYGMVLVLLVLVLVISGLTNKQQYPTGADAGRQVARWIVSQSSGTPQVVIVGRATAEDRQFTEAVEQTLQSLDAEVLGKVNGGPADVRRTLQALIDAGKTPTAIAANNVTAKWSVYDRFDGVGSEKCVIPQPYYWPDFLKVSNLLNIANQTAIYALIAVGMTMVIITAGIDLSVGSLVALSAVSAALTVQALGGKEAGGAAVAAGIAVGVLGCALAGACNGLVVIGFEAPSLLLAATLTLVVSILTRVLGGVVWWQAAAAGAAACLLYYLSRLMLKGKSLGDIRVPPFIATLAMMMMASGLAFRMSDGQSISDLPQAFYFLGGGQVGGVPNPVWLMVIFYVAAHIIMSRTIFGRYVYAIGGNEEAARLSGVPVKMTLLTVYTLSGALAGLGGVVLTSQLAAGDPKYGLMYELEVIAAVVVGGASLMGGEGKIFGTLIGAFIIAVIKNGMNLTNVDPFNQKIVLGAVLLGAVLLDTIKRRASA